MSGGALDACAIYVGGNDNSSTLLRASERWHRSIYANGRIRRLIWLRSAGTNNAIGLMVGGNWSRVTP